MEALASGLLAVVSEIPGLKEFLGQDINESGIIEYVSLSNMSYQSLPEKETLKIFEKDLERKLDQQINRHLEDFSIPNNVRKQIEKKSWNHIYREIESVF